MKWISVKEVLPEEWVKVLSADFDEDPPRYLVDYIIKFEDQEPVYIWACRLQDEWEKVTHWMPLPEPANE